MTTQQQVRLEKEEPTPKVKRHDYDWSDFARQMREAPYEWHVIFRKDRFSFYTAIKQGSIAALRESKGFETTTRNNVRVNLKADPPVTERTCKLLMRYVPELDQSIDDLDMALAKEEAKRKQTDNERQADATPSSER